MKVGMILNAFYPEDIRITKEATALLEGGIEVCLLCAKKEGQASRETIKGIEVMRIAVGEHVYVTTFWDTINAAFWWHPLFSKGVEQFIQTFQPDVLHVHDLPLVNTIHLAGQKYGLPVVADLHENFPAGLRTWFSIKTNPIVKLKNFLFFQYDRWLSYEKRMVKKVDHIIAVVEEMKSRMMAIHQLPDEKITVITNTEPKQFLENRQIFADVIHRYQDRFVIGYVGGVGPHRGLDTIVEALPLIRQDIPEIQLMIVGKGSFMPKLKERVKACGVEDLVDFVAFQPFEKVFSFMVAADINVIPHHRNEHTDNTIPHKLFQNMMVGKALLVSDADPLKRVVSETDGGFIFTASDPNSVHQEVLKIYRQPDLVAQKIKNAKYHVLEGQYNWETTGAELVQFYQAFLDKQEKS